MNKKPKDNFKEFKKRKSKHYFMSLLVASIFTLSFVSLGQFASILPNIILFVTSAIAMLSFSIFTYFNWRCPSCNGFLPLPSIYIKLHFCNNCGQELIERTKSLFISTNQE